LFSVTLVSDVCLSIYYTCFWLCFLLLCWVREIFSCGSGHIFSVWDSAVWSAGPVQFHSGIFLEWMAGLYRFSFLWFCCSGYGMVELVKGGGLSSFCFLPFVVSSFGGWMSVVGFLCYIFRFSWWICGIFLRFHIL
jgi:hypothetical protein